MTKVYDKQMNFLGLTDDVNSVGKIKSRGLEMGKDGQVSGYVVLASSGIFVSCLGLVK